ncbi:glycosyltransferase involved in cell wall biosynthesis [Nocardioides daedukensis]|uniref:Glycosyltransferase involved in cell wall biosynthesis n=1 Tax=Nocardioides daedukensis TaxID=634462 RepID=A0A7Y9S3D2_9ACTN|nr:glycosyltransferase family 2 protein [Nocardioides daedukensis]NYG59807.1 glycosyltransferase involved in cell wall biosynthesis [Nocardioides daedukensis]
MPAIYTPESGPPQKSVGVSVIVLTKNESLNIVRCLASVAWADQVLVVDSGSTDETVQLACDSGAEVVETTWRGFGAQREYALRLDVLQNNWIFFVDADEWVSGELAREILQAISSGSDKVAYWMFFRLVFQGRWIQHCGWYPSSRIIRLMDRRRVRFGSSKFSEHPDVQGSVGRLQSDLVDDDQKGLSAWLHKHVDYAELESQRRLAPAPGKSARREHESRLRYLLKDRVAGNVPMRPLVQFIYMYVLKRGFLDGSAGFAFCFYHAWFQFAVSNLQAETNRVGPTRS